MARRKPKSRRKQSQPRSRKTPVQGDTQAATPAKQAAQPATSAEDLAETYSYVRRDLIRIGVLAVIMFVISVRTSA